MLYVVFANIKVFSFYTRATDKACFTPRGWTGAFSLLLNLMKRLENV